MMRWLRRQLWVQYLAQWWCDRTGGHDWQPVDAGAGEYCGRCSVDLP